MNLYQNVLLSIPTHTSHTQDLMNIARTTLSSKLLTQHKDHFARLAVEAVLRLKGSGDLQAIQIIKKLGGNMLNSYLDEGTVCVCVCLQVCCVWNGISSKLDRMYITNSSRDVRTYWTYITNYHVLYAHILSLQSHLAYTNCLNFSSPNAAASSSFSSICAYLDSVSVSAHHAYTPC